MLMNRWAPFREMLTLNSAVEQLFNNAFVPSTARTGWSPNIACNIAEQDEAGSHADVVASRRRRVVV
jgi:hypothetical protein